MSDTPYADIRRRLAEATGPDTMLDAAIAKCLGIGRGDKPFIDFARPFTASLDAALALVEEKLPGTMYVLRGGGPSESPAVAELVAGTHEINIPLAEYEGATLPLAVLSALFAALEAQHD